VLRVTSEEVSLAMTSRIRAMPAGVLWSNRSNLDDTVGVIDWVSNAVESFIVQYSRW